MQVGDEPAVHEWFQKIIPDIKGTDPKMELLIANSLWAAADVKGAFADVCKEVFLSEVYPLGSSAQINSWVSESTRGKIDKLLDTDPIGPAVLLNAVYFKGEWTNKVELLPSPPRSFAPFLIKRVVIAFSWRWTAH